MNAMLIAFLIYGTTIVNGILFLIWSKNDFFNILLKFYFMVSAFMALYLINQMWSN